MATAAKQRMDALRSSSAGMVVLEYLREELQTRMDSLVSCTKDTFDTQKGRCVELQQQIKYLEGKGS